jgi:hypothetical protein
LEKTVDIHLVVYEMKGGAYYKEGVALDMASHLDLRGVLQRKHLVARRVDFNREEFRIVFDLDRDENSRTL